MRERGYIVAYYTHRGNKPGVRYAYDVSGSGIATRAGARVFTDRNIAVRVGNLIVRQLQTTAGVFPAHFSPGRIKSELTGTRSNPGPHPLGTCPHGKNREKCRDCARARKKKNPVPRSGVAAAKELFRDFRGEEPARVTRVRIPAVKAGLVIGELDGVLYTTSREGKRESYIHKFRKSSRPLLVSSSDGKSLHMIGGSYRFTDRGITDR